MASSFTSIGRGSGAQDSDVKLATDEQLSTIRRLAQIVARIFYEDRHIVLMDQLVSITVLPADVLAHRLGTQVKELAALASKLLEDKLICTFRRNETKDNIHNRTFQRTYYYLDYKLFLDVTKWRMMSIRKKIDQRLRNELDNKGYVCPRCKRSYSTLEVAHLLDVFRNLFVCDNPGCNTELVDNEEAEDVKKSKDSLMRFNEQLGNILGGLRKVEGITLPPLDVGAWLVKHAASQPWNIRHDDDATLPVPTSTNGVASGLQVDLASNDPAAEAARRAAKLKAEEEQRKQNALPAWHLASTVSGEQTSLGRKQSRLQGQVGVHIEETKKQEDEEEDDYFAQYASLQNAEEEARAVASQAQVAHSEGRDDSPELEFEDVDAPVTSLDASAQSHKRSRSDSASDVANADGNLASKRTKADSQDAASAPTGAPADDEEDFSDFEDVV
ncbi:hypothetical protein ACQY0O_000998 [Thecaphora frezii]